VSPAVDEAAADEGDRRRAVQQRQFSDRIQEQHVAGSRGRSAAQPGAPARGAAAFGHLPAALGVPRRQYEQAVVVRPAQSREGRQHKGLFTRVGAARHHHIAARQLQFLPQRRGPGAGGVVDGDVELEGAGDPTGGRLRPQGAEATRDRLRLAGEYVHRFQHGSHEG